MQQQDFTTRFTVAQSPEKVFETVNNVRGWWSQQITGRTDALNEIFNYHYKDVHRCKMKIIEFVPGKKVVWQVLENYFDFVNDQTEWDDTTVIFEISEKNGNTELIFTHAGLVPADECFGICSEAWGNYIRNSLHNLIENGKGDPNPYIPVVEDADNLSKSK